ncbi:hypothetical protein AKJ09_04267 [Labilithrix luteola]|uniref:Uncharacterized protein n=1 Tax=Labilithrix luteola TaxID=1391654 RepID=A0A0K1PVP5_9BACT|nr:hypothetical protein [Labilithrix luteola]AKU97603.1 hypothetical protein AKJ09_04267 [Labilithrix luteola]
MSPNPYQAPVPRDPYGAPAAPVNRTPVILAAVGAGLASLYWAGLTLLIGLAAASGAGSTFQVILPCVLIGLYALRGFQLVKGDPLAAKRLLWLHGMGGAMAVLQIANGGAFLVVLQSIKLVIHVFGAVTAHFAQRALNGSR